MLPDTDNFNVTFVKAVEDYPAIYDTTSKEYSNRDDQEKSWKALAQKFESTDAECKGRWKHLRGGLARYMKKRTGDKAKKSYHLWGIMQFVVPFMKSRPQSGSLPQLNQPHNDGDMKPAENSRQDEEDAVSEGKSIDDTDPPTSLSMSATSSAGSSKRPYKCRKAPPDEFENMVSEYIAIKRDAKQNNPDLDFFKNILPDISDFNPSKKEILKQESFNLLRNCHVPPHVTEYANPVMPIANESQDQPVQISSLQSYYQHFSY